MVMSSLTSQQEQLLAELRAGDNYRLIKTAFMDALAEAAERVPGFRKPNPTIVPFPTNYDRHPFPGNGVNKIMLSEGKLIDALGTVTSFQAPAGYVARSFFIISDGDVEVTVYGSGRQWGPFFVEQMTPAPFSNLICERVDLKCSPSFDAQLIFSDDVYPPLEIAAFGAYPCIRIATHTTGDPGVWENIRWGAGNMSTKQLVPLAGRFTVLEAMAIGRKHIIIENTTANPANVRVLGSMLLDDTMRLDAINGATGSLVVPASDFVDIQFVTPWKSIRVQAQTPAGGTATSLLGRFMGVSQGS